MGCKKIFEYRAKNRIHPPPLLQGKEGGYIISFTSFEVGKVDTSAVLLPLREGRWIHKQFYFLRGREGGYISSFTSTKGLQLCGTAPCINPYKHLMLKLSYCHNSVLASAYKYYFNSFLIFVFLCFS